MSIAEALRLSLSVAGRSVLFSLPFAVLIAWLLTRRRFVGRTVLDAFVHLPLVLPPVVVGYLLLVLFGTRGPIGGWLDRRVRRAAHLHDRGRGARDGGHVLPADGARDPHVARVGGPAARGRRAHARRRAARPLPHDHAAADAAGRARGRGHGLCRRPRRVRRRHHLRVEHPGRDAHAAARALHRDAVAGRRCARGAARARCRSRSGSAGCCSPSGSRGACAAGWGADARRRGQQASAASFTLDAAFTMPAPGVVALFGRSGCGKTTLVDMHRGPASIRTPGTIRLDGEVLVDTARRHPRAGGAPAHRLRVPGRAAVSAPRRGRATCATGLTRARAGGATRPSTTSLSLLGLAAAARPPAAASSRAASASASRSGARCSRTRGCCCSTSRSPRSMPRAARRCCPTSSGCATTSRSRSSTSATSSTKCCASRPTSC